MTSQAKISYVASAAKLESCGSAALAFGYIHASREHDFTTYFVQKCVEVSRDSPRTSFKVTSGLTRALGK